MTDHADNEKFSFDLKSSVESIQTHTSHIPHAIEFPPPTGKEGECLRIKIRLLHVDEEYQRGEKSDHARQIAQKWNWNAVKVITVAKRDGKLWVVDGQHIVCAARMRGDIEELWCYVIADMESRVNEAMASFMTNNNRRRPSLIENHHTLIAANDAKACDIEQIVTQRGYEITSTKKERCPIKAVGTLNNIYDGYDAKMLDEVLRFHSVAWENNTATLHANALKAITRLIDRISQEKPEIDIVDVARNVSKSGPEEMLEIWAEMNRFKLGAKKISYQMSVGIAKIHDRHCKNKDSHILATIIGGE